MKFLKLICFLVHVITSLLALPDFRKILPQQIWRQRRRHWTEVLCRNIRRPVRNLSALLIAPSAIWLTQTSTPFIPMMLVITTIWPLCLRFMSGSTLALQWSNHANIIIVHYNSRLSCDIICLWKHLKLTLKVSMIIRMRGDRPRISTRLSSRLLTQSLMEASQQPSNSLISRVFFKESPATFFQGPPFPEIPHCGNPCLRQTLSTLSVSSCIYFYHLLVFGWGWNRLSSSLASRAATAKPKPEEHPVTSTLLVPMAVWPLTSRLRRILTAQPQKNCE